MLTVSFAALPLATPAARRSQPPGPDVSLLDLIELEIGHTTLADRYYQHIDPQRLLDGARSGIVAYLHGRGIASPAVAYLHARPDGRGSVPAIEQQIGKAIERYGRRVNARELVYGAIRGELAALHDPYSMFFTKAQLKGFSTALDGETFGGIGVVLANDEATHRWRIDQIFDDGPAARAGVRSGDEIAAVDGQPVGDIATASVRLRGKTGTSVSLSIVRDAVPLADAIVITRALVSPPNVVSRLLPGGIGYVALRAFDAQAGTELRTALGKLDAQGARATIFDLRGNGGGYESASVHVASLFVARGPIVSIQENHGKRRITNADGNALAPRPLVVLVNHDSASGSELVTAAIEDHRAGTTVGTQTYGKGLVQSVFPLPDGSALKVTTARYFTPDGHDIDRVGITPDIVVDEPSGSRAGVPGSDPQLDRAITIVARETAAH